MPVDPRTAARCLLLGGFVLVGACHSGVARADSGTDRKPWEAVIVEPETVIAEKVAGWKKEGFRAIVVAVDDRHEAAVLQKAAKAVAASSLDLYCWIEVGRNPALAREHPEWMASLGSHDDWRKLFPKVRGPGKKEVAKVWPWVPISYREAFEAHLARVTKLVARLPEGYRGLLLNNLQGGPSSCGCGNLQCRWAVDYHVPATGTKLEGPDVAAKFLAEVAKIAKGKEVIPVWTTECEQEDLPEEKRPKGSWGTGCCGSVPCFEFCRRQFTAQWTALQAGRRGPTGVLVLHKEFQRDRKEYGDTAAWVARAVDYLDKAGKAKVPHQQLWLVVQGYGVTADEEAAGRRVAVKTGPGAVLIARTRIDQSYEPRIIKVSGR